MSVEEARERTHEAVMRGCEEWHEGDDCDCAHLTDDLILEVQAAMPCVDAHCCEGTEQHPDCLEIGRQPPCPSCTARAELERRKAAVRPPPICELTPLTTTNSVRQ